MKVHGVCVSVRRVRTGARSGAEGGAGAGGGGQSAAAGQHGVQELCVARGDSDAPFAQERQVSRHARRKRLDPFRAYERVRRRVATQLQYRILPPSAPHRTALPHRTAHALEEKGGTLTSRAKTTQYTADTTELLGMCVSASSSARWINTLIKLVALP